MRPLDNMYSKKMKRGEGGGKPHPRPQPFQNLMQFIIIFFFISFHILSSPLFSLSLLLVVVAQIRGRIAGSPPPSPLLMPCTFIAEILLQPFLLSWTRVEWRLPTRYALSAIDYFVLLQIKYQCAEWLIKLSC